MIDADIGQRWVVIHRNSDEPIVRRYPVPGGWLYQVSEFPWNGYDATLAFHPPVFVPFHAKYPEGVS